MVLVVQRCWMHVELGNQTRLFLILPPLISPAPWKWKWGLHDSTSTISDKLVKLHVKQASTRTLFLWGPLRIYFFVHLTLVWNQKKKHSCFIVWTYMSFGASGHVRVEEAERCQALLLSLVYEQEHWKVLSDCKSTTLLLLSYPITLAPFPFWR